MTPRVLTVALSLATTTALLPAATAPADAAAPRPAVQRPDHVHVLHPTGHGLALGWSGEPAHGFTIKQARNRSMTNAVRTYHVHGNITQFTPFGLRSHAHYYFRVRAGNGSGHSRYSGVVRGRLPGRESAMSMVTWNVLHARADGTKENGNRVAPWHKRVKVVVSMLRAMHPDLININEGNDFLHSSGRYRQIDSIETRLKKTYALASADFTAAKYHPQVGNYVLYRRSMFRPLYRHEHGKSHCFDLGTKHFAMYQAFANRHSGARFLFVSLHLASGPNGPTANRLRTRETRRLLDDVAKLRRTHPRYRRLPVIYAGDTNSFAGSNPHSLDGPGDLLRARHATDALMAAQSRKNTKYGSVNGYTRVPSHTGKIIDHFYATAGVSFKTWRQVMHLKHGRWPGVIPSDHNPILVHALVQH